MEKKNLEQMKNKLTFKLIDLGIEGLEQETKKRITRNDKKWFICLVLISLIYVGAYI